MNDENTKSTGGFALLANGSSSRWNIAIDESLDRDEWSMEVEGSQVYLVLQLDSLEVPRKALDFLESQFNPHRTRPAGRSATKEDTLALGQFGSTPVLLLKDNEGAPRVFLAVGAGSRSAFRVTLDVEDIKSLVEAFRQVVKDMSEETEVKTLPEKVRKLLRH
jgi:hypothetical protein